MVKLLELDVHTWLNPLHSMFIPFAGDWHPGEKNKRADFKGSVFGPTSLVINNECGGEDQAVPGGPHENRRIKAFRWFCEKLGVEPGPSRTLSCKGRSG